MKLSSLAIATLCSGILPTSLFAFDSKVSAETCITWAEFSRTLSYQGEDNKYHPEWKAFGNLPPEFENGCVLLQRNNPQSSALILKVGISPDPYKSESSYTSPYNSESSYISLRVPKSRGNGGQLVTQGKAIAISWLHPTNGMLPILRTRPRNRTFMDGYGATCFNLVCMKSGALSHEKLTQILSQSSIVSAETCITWAKFSRDLPSQNDGRSAQWRAFGSLPPEFENGCVLLRDANSLDTAYVLKVGISPEPYKNGSLNSSQKVPDFNDSGKLEQLVTKGNALRVVWLNGTNAVLSYIRTIPTLSDLRTARENAGPTCFKGSARFDAVCMQSGALSWEKLADILSEPLLAQAPNQCNKIPDCDSAVVIKSSPSIQVTNQCHKVAGCDSTVVMKIENSTQEVQRYALVEMVIVNHDGKLWKNANPFRNLQGNIVEFIPPLQPSESRMVRVMYRKYAKWKSATLSTFQWYGLQRPDYFEIYPELKNFPMP